MRCLGRLSVFLTVIGVLCAGIGGTAATTRGLEIKARNTGQTVALYAESHALIIGVSDYVGGWPPLRGVKSDVPAVKAALEKQGFQVEVVMNPDRDGMDRAFRSFINHYGLKPDNRLLFYYAGHGHSMKLGYGGMMGYLVGRDAPNPNVDKAGFRDRALSMQVIETYAKNIESKHALFMFDACFAGSVFDATRAIPEVIAAKTGKPVREFITSGTADQQVPDKSIFRREFVAALDGEGDLDHDGYVTGAELGQFLEAKVTNYSQRAQTPQYGKLRDPLLDKGDFVFALPSAEAAATAPTTGPSASTPSTPAAGPSAEVVFWQSIQSSTNVAMFEEYLRQFPQGRFAGLARLKIQEIRQAQTAALTPPASNHPATEPSGAAMAWANDLIGLWAMTHGGERWIDLRIERQGSRLVGSVLKYFDGSAKWIRIRVAKIEGDSSNLTIRFEDVNDSSAHKTLSLHLSENRRTLSGSINGSSYTKPFAVTGDRM